MHRQGVTITNIIRKKQQVHRALDVRGIRALGVALDVRGIRALGVALGVRGIRALGVGSVECRVPEAPLAARCLS